MPKTATVDAPPASPYLLALREALRQHTDPLVRFDVGALGVEIVATDDSLFAIVRRPGAGGLAIRAAFLPAPFDCTLLRAKAGEAARLRFDVNYQANLTAWGAAACMRLWRITNRDVYREQSYVYLASFLHNAVIWDSQIDHAAHYETFLAVTCLQDAPYMALYECFDSFVAFEHYLDDGGPDLEPEARMLLAEYCKYALSRAWFYYPDALPPEAIADTQREANGHIDRTLSFPLEDLYPDGQQAGQVGQEVYGAGAAFIFVSRAFHRIEDAPFLLFCDNLLHAVERTGDRALTIQLDGGETCIANLRLIRLKRRKLPKSSVTTAGGDAIRAHATAPDRIDYHVPANGRLVLTWE